MISLYKEKLIIREHMSKIIMFILLSCITTFVGISRFVTDNKITLLIVTLACSIFMVSQIMNVVIVDDNSIIYKTMLGKTEITFDDIDSLDIREYKTSDGFGKTYEYVGLSTENKKLFSVNGDYIHLEEFIKIIESRNIQIRRW